MKSGPAIHRRRMSRPSRVEMPRAMMLIVLLVLAVLRPVLGPAALLHDDHDLGAHTHSTPVLAIAERGDCSHEDHARPSQVTDLDGLPDTPGPCSPVISLFDDHSLPGGAPTVASRDSAGVVIALPCWPRPAALNWREEPGSPGGGSPRGPRHLGALVATDRLIATSRALLI